MNWLIKNFLRGLVVVVPTALTVYLLYVSFTSIDRVLRPTLERQLGIDVPGLGLLIIVIGTILVGVLAGNFLIRELLVLVEKLFTRAPIVRIVYAAIKDLLEAFVGNRRRFDRPVVVTLSDGVSVFGFVTRPDLEALSLEGQVGVYVPFSYTWDGCLLVVASDRVRPLQADSANIMALVVSGGVSRAGSS